MCHESKHIYLPCFVLTTGLMCDLTCKPPSRPFQQQLYFDSGGIASYVGCALTPVIGRLVPN